MDKIVSTISIILMLMDSVIQAGQVAAYILLCVALLSVSAKMYALFLLRNFVWILCEQYRSWCVVTDLS